MSGVEDLTRDNSLSVSPCPSELYENGGYESVLSVTQPGSITVGANQELVQFWVVAE